jgi:histidine triad (HIT) family protein
MGDCVFCAIVAGQAPASIVYADHVVVAFLDRGPINPGHLLVVPRVHVPSLTALDVETGGHLFTVGMRMDRVLRSSGLRCEGVHLSLADGEAAGQEVAHVHLHVVPRFAGDGFSIVANWSRPPREDLNLVAEQLRGADEALGAA